jgi:hypothetical protein
MHLCPHNFDIVVEPLEQLAVLHEQLVDFSHQDSHKVQPVLISPIYF